jgi:hypothetical protein
MEENVATFVRESSYSLNGCHHRGIPPPNPPSSVQTTVVLTPSTSGSGIIPYSVATTLCSQSATSPPFSYGILNFDTNSVLTYSTLQIMGLIVGSSKYLFARDHGGTLASYNIIPYGGGHIPPPSPSLNGAFQQLIKPNTNYNLFGVGILGLYSYTTSGGIHFILFVRCIW